MGLYPGSSDSPIGATIYGPLPDHGFTEMKLVLHTTETAQEPSFNGGDTAPHYVYNPRTREWTMWAEYEDGRVGTLRGHSTNHANCMAFQVEIIAYSDNRYGPWVGDFTDDQYQDLADFYSWAMDRYPIGASVTPTPAGGWLYGVSAPTRGTWDQYEALSGLTAHGFVQGNTHWDTGVLDLQRIHDLAMTEPEKDLMYLPIEYGTERTTDMKWIQRILNRGGSNITVDGVYGDDTAQAVASHVGGDGRIIKAKAFDRIMYTAYTTDPDDQH